MKAILLLSLLATFTFPLFVQSQEIPIEDRFDNLAGDWLEMSGRLKTYQGVQEYCKSPEYRKELNSILVQIHHYDSLILSRMDDSEDYLSWNPKEEKRTHKDIDQLESEYSLTNFISQMRESCSFRRDIEKEKENLKNGIGSESYDGKILLLETEVRRYLNQMDKLVLKIDDHLHILHLDY